MLHVASLVHDDIIDNASQRRGVPCVHTVHGLQQSVFTANFMMGRAGRVLSSLGDLRLFQCYGAIMESLTGGEYLQAKRNRDFGQIRPLAHSYMLKSYLKTGSMFA